MHLLTALEFRATNSVRYPSLLYTNDGKKLQDRLWKETIEELQATGAASVLESIKMWISYSDKLQVEQLELNT